MIGSRDDGFGLRASHVRRALARLAAGVFAVSVAASAASAEDAVLNLRASLVTAPSQPLTISLFRWSTDAERIPVIAALAPPTVSAAAAGPAGRGGRAGRAGGRGAAPPSPAARVSAAIKAAPTIGYIWGDGVTGYSIKYAWRARGQAAGGRAGTQADRVVLIIDRRLGVHLPAGVPGSGPAPDAEYTLIEMRLDGTGGEGKTSLDAAVVHDAASGTLALDGYASAATHLRMTR